MASLFIFHREYEWKGKWGDDDTGWTPDLIKQANMVVANDGTFWMSIDDFKKYYEGSAVCKIQTNFNYHSIAIEDDSGDENSHLVVRCVLKTGSKNITFSVN